MERNKDDWEGVLNALVQSFHASFHKPTFSFDYDVARFVQTKLIFLQDCNIRTFYYVLGRFPTTDLGWVSVPYKNCMHVKGFDCYYPFKCQEYPGLIDKPAFRLSPFTQHGEERTPDEDDYMDE